MTDVVAPAGASPAPVISYCKVTDPADVFAAASAWKIQFIRQSDADAAQRSYDAAVVAAKQILTDAQAALAQAKTQTSAILAPVMKRAGYKPSATVNFTGVTIAADGSATITCQG